VPGWPFAGDGAILLINDGPDAPLEVQVRPKDAFECSFRRRQRLLHDPRAAAARLPRRAAPRLLLKIDAGAAGASQR
jgi:hypothetical protein